MKKYSFLYNADETEIVNVRALVRVSIIEDKLPEAFLRGVTMVAKYDVIGFLENEDEFIFLRDVDLLTARERLNKIAEQLNEVNDIFNKRWLKFNEALMYAPCGKKRLRDLALKTCEIYAIKDGGDIIIDRLSVDAYYDRDRKVAVAAGGKK